MLARNLFFKLSVVAAISLLALASALPGASAEALAFPTLQVTRSGSGDLAATAAAAATQAAAAATQATKLAATAAALATKGASLKATLTPLATTGSEVASTAIAAYASNVLGINVRVKKAGGLTGDVSKLLSQTPSGSKAQLSAVNLAVTSYGALLSNGAATLSYGKGTVTGDVTVDVQGASLGVYSLTATYSGALNADTALNLAKTTFPGVAKFSYTSYPVSKGYAWYAKGTVTGYDVKTKKFVTMAESVILYVLPGTSGKATVTATVGRGEFAAAVKP